MSKPGRIWRSSATILGSCVPDLREYDGAVRRHSGSAEVETAAKKGTEEKLPRLQPRNEPSSIRGAWLGNSQVPVCAETARRIACDAGKVRITHRSGQILSVGRKTRTIPPPIRRALEFRDQGCRFPGCTSKHCDAHHIVHWADSGETKLSNLVLLCRRHHRRLHEGGFSVSSAAREREVRAPEVDESVTGPAIADRTDGQHPSQRYPSRAADRSRTDRPTVGAPAFRPASAANGSRPD